MYACTIYLVPQNTAVYIPYIRAMQQTAKQTQAVPLLKCCCTAVPAWHDTNLILVPGHDLTMPTTPLQNIGVTSDGMNQKYFEHCYDLPND